MVDEKVRVDYLCEDISNSLTLQAKHDYETGLEFPMDNEDLHLVRFLAGLEYKVREFTKSICETLPNMLMNLTEWKQEIEAIVG